MFWRFWLPNVPFATAACIFSTSARTKVVQTRHVLCILTSKCAFHHSGVQFFDISSYKSALGMRCFVHFHFRMCFSPQRRAIFRHLNFKKCSETVCFWTFSLPDVLFATAACNFWFIRRPPDSAPAALTGLLFDWPDTRIIEKTQHFVTSLTFSADVSSFTWLSHYCIFCPLTWLLCCCALHLLFNSPYCRKFLFKLPSTSLFDSWPKNAEDSSALTSAAEAWAWVPRTFQGLQSGFTQRSTPMSTVRCLPRPWEKHLVMRFRSPHAHQPQKNLGIQVKVCLDCMSCNLPTIFSTAAGAN